MSSERKKVRAIEEGDVLPGHPHLKMLIAPKQVVPRGVGYVKEKEHSASQGVVQRLFGML